MNRTKWQDDKIPVTVLALKLSEEAAEVGTEITDAFNESRAIDRKKLIEECEHTIFIASAILDRAARGYHVW